MELLTFCRSTHGEKNLAQRRRIVQSEILLTIMPIKLLRVWLKFRLSHVHYLTVYSKLHFRSLIRTYVNGPLCIAAHDEEFRRIFFSCDLNDATKQTSPITSVLTEGQRRRRVGSHSTVYHWGFISRARCDRQWEDVTYISSFCQSFFQLTTLLDRSAVEWASDCRQINNLFRVSDYWSTWNKKRTLCFRIGRIGRFRIWCHIERITTKTWHSFCHNLVNRQWRQIILTFRSPWG